MVPVTVALIKNSTYNMMEDVCEIDGIKLHQVGSWLDACKFNISQNIRG